MAVERNVPPCHGSNALSRPMREDAPADKITPANEGERAIAVFMIQTYKAIPLRFSISMNQGKSVRSGFALVGEDFYRFRALHVRQRSGRASANGDQLSDNGDGNFFRRNRANIDAHGGEDARQLFRRDAFFFQFFVNSNSFALRANHTN